MNRPGPQASTLLLLLLLALAAAPLACSNGAAEPPPLPTPTPKASDAPVLVELFTSQGCSSCPPADRVLSELGGKQGVVALAFHVDYWDYIGWKDPFASADWSSRQRAYASVMDSSRVYTPQLVVAGREHLVGSNRAQVQAAIDKARALPPIADLHVEQAPAPGEPRRLRVTVQVKPRPGAPDAPHQLFIALVEDQITTQVTRGENTGRDLRNDHIVRELQKACTLAGPASGARTCEARFDLDPTWKPAHLRAVAFAQRPDTMHIGAVGVSR